MLGLESIFLFQVLCFGNYYKNVMIQILVVLDIILEVVANCTACFQGSSVKQLLTHRWSQLVQHDFHTGHNLLEEEPKSDTSN